MYVYKSLNDISYKEIADCFNRAFSDYSLNIQLTEDELKLHFEITGVDKKLSYGAFLDNQMIGFIFNSYGIYNGEKVVFDVGTGVVPQQRGKKVFSNLFEYNQLDLQKHNINKYYLEVLKQNNKAIDAYKKKGFTVIREFSILQSSNILSNINFEQVKYIDYKDFCHLNITKCEYLNPSYEHNTNILNKNPQLYNVMYIEQDSIVSAFCIFSKKNGNIVGLGFYDKEDIKIIIQQLISKYSNVIVKNIDIIYTEILSLLYSLGFCEVAKQFEMAKDI